MKKYSITVSIFLTKMYSHKNSGRHNFQPEYENFWHANIKIIIRMQKNSFAQRVILLAAFLFIANFVVVKENQSIFGHQMS